MNVVYRMVAALLAVVSGAIVAGLVVALTGETDGDINALWFGAFAIAALLAAGAAVVLWARAGRR